MKIIATMFQAGLICVAGFFLSSDCNAQDTSRKLSASDLMPPFSVVDSQGLKFSYDPQTSGALLVLFYSPAKTQSAKAAEDIAAVLTSFETMPHKLAFLAVSDDPNSVSSIKVSTNGTLTARFINDRDFELWGKFGVIASPTVFLAGPDGRIVLIKPGYGYDFAPAIKSKIQQIMGLVSKEDTAAASVVRTVSNDSERQKADRHLKMAQLLEEKGDNQAALLQLKTTIRIDPNSIEALLQLARLYGVMSDPNQAIEIAQPLRPLQKPHQVLRALVLGNAYGQLQDCSNAEKYLLEAVSLDPKESRALYELGRIYQSQSKTDKAMEAYRQSLDIVYGSP